MKHSIATPLLTSGEITLQPYAQEHDRQTVSWLTDQEIRQSFGITTLIDIHSHRKWIEAQENLLIWAITIPSNKHIGNATLRVNMEPSVRLFRDVSWSQLLPWQRVWLEIPIGNS